MSGVVFVTRALPEEAMQELAAAPEVRELRVNPHDRPVTRAELREGLTGAAALLAQLVDRVDAEALEWSPGLRVVANYAVGLDNVDVGAATARGVLVANTPDVLTESTADLTWALILAVARRLVEGDRILREGRWPGWSPTYLLGSEVHGKTLGVVGLGRIGAAVARRGLGFGMRLLYAAPRPRPELAAALEARHVPLEELLAQADFVSLHAPSTPATRHLIDAAALARMRPGAFLINTSRGPLVDEAALVAALRAGRPAGAGLDVFEREPALAPGLAELPQVVLAPHVGSATRDTRLAMARTAIAAVLAGLRGETPRTCVNPEVSRPRSAGA